MANERHGDGSVKSKLSKHLREMKFMQRSQENDILKENEEEERRRVDETHWVLDLPEITAKESKYEVELSHAVCKDLMFGRMSFKGMNPEVEKIMHNVVAEDQEKKSEQKEREMMVSDEEMARRYGTVVNTVGNKFTTKRQRSQASGSEPTKKVKREFKKPPDE